MLNFVHSRHPPTLASHSFTFQTLMHLFVNSIVHQIHTHSQNSYTHIIHGIDFRTNTNIVRKHEKRAR